MMRDHPHRKNFIISLCNYNEQKRGVLDIVNRIHYKEKGIEIISARCIMEEKQNEKKTFEPNDFIKYIFALSETFPDSNIGVDEVPLELLAMQKKIVHENFKGSICLALSAIAKYDFKDENEAGVSH